MNVNVLNLENFHFTVPSTWSTKEDHTGERVHLVCFSVMKLMPLLENSTVSREQNNAYSSEFLRTA